MAVILAIHSVATMSLCALRQWITSLLSLSMFFDSTDLQSLVLYANRQYLVFYFSFLLLEHISAVTTKKCKHYDFRKHG